MWIPDVPIKLDVHTSRKQKERVVPGCGRAKNHEDAIELLGSKPIGIGRWRAKSKCIGMINLNTGYEVGVGWT